MNENATRNRCAVRYGADAVLHAPSVARTMIGLPYKNTFAGKGSALYAALTEGPEKERAAKAKAVYDATTARMLALTQPKKSENTTAVTFADKSVL